jgi:Rieske Fe-S protein
MNSRSGNQSIAETSATRRSFMQWFSWLILGLGSLAAAIPILGFLLGPIIKSKPDEWVDFGPIEEFPENTTRLVDSLNPLRGPNDGMTGKTAAYVRRIEGEAFQVFSPHCTHLGCPVTWFKESGLYMCPCHGGAYYEDGGYASGPPPRGLYELLHRIDQGRLMVLLGHLPTLQDPGSADVTRRT